MSKEFLPQFYAMLEKNIGIKLDDTKLYLIESRLLPLSKKNKHPDVYSFIKLLTQSVVSNLHREAFEALTTNETSFFRDKHVFDSLKEQILPALITSRAEYKSLGIWSSAVSAGQEAYSVAILIHDNFPELLGWNITIQATDVSELMLEKAKTGIYSASEVRRGLNDYYLRKYFIRQDNGTFLINDSIRSMVNFIPHNLVSSWPNYQKFDLILLRNVLIYFNQDVKNKVLEKTREYLDSNNGVLILGGAESIYLNKLFKLVSLDKSSYYRAN